MSNDSVLQSLLNEYHNGNIEYVKNKLKVYNISFSEFFDYFAESYGETLFIEDLKLLVLRLT